MRIFSGSLCLDGVTKLFCQKCGGPIELELGQFQSAGVSMVDCPHCQAPVRLFDSPAVAPPVIPQMAKPRIANPVTVPQVISWFALTAFFGWSALMVIWGMSACFGWVKGGFLHPHSDAEQVGAFFGVVISIAILFGIWLVGAMPSFLVWFIFKKR